METIERAKRGVLLTEKELENLQDNKMDAKSRSKLLGKLDSKFEVLATELSVIAKTKVLQSWREIKKQESSKQLEDVYLIFNKISKSESTKKLYYDYILSDKIDGETVYWAVEVKNHLPNYPKKLYYSDRIFKETNVLRGIKARKNVKKLLLKAYRNDKLPKQKKMALTIPEIKDLVRK